MEEAEQAKTAAEVLVAVAEAVEPAAAPAEGAPLCTCAHTLLGLRVAPCLVLVGLGCQYLDQSRLLCCLTLRLGHAVDAGALEARPKKKRRSKEVDADFALVALQPNRARRSSAGVQSIIPSSRRMSLPCNHVHA